MIIDVKDWTKVNVWRTSAGDFCVRPGFRKVYRPSSLVRQLVGGFSIQNSYIPEVWHYVFDMLDGEDLKLHIMDETFQVFQTFSIKTDRIPRVITHAVVENQVVIASPDFATLWGIVGSGIRYAQTVQPDGAPETALAVPRGICTSWCNTVAIADGRSLYISDGLTSGGGDTRTFFASSLNQRPGVIYGLHEGAGDMLIAVTSEGTYGLPSDATSVAAVQSGGVGWRLLNHHRATSYASSCAVRGRVYALTAEGWGPVDTETVEDVKLSEPAMSRTVFPRISLSDYRICKMFALDDGPIVGDDMSGAVNFNDVTRGLTSWWWFNTEGGLPDPQNGTPGALNADSKLRGVLRNLDGSQMIVTETGVFAIGGDMDGADAALSPPSGKTRGCVVGRIPVDPASVLVSNITWGSGEAGEFGEIGVSLRGVRKYGTCEPDGNGYTIEGNDTTATTWETTTRRLTTSPLTLARFDFGPAMAERGDEITLELDAAGPSARLPSAIQVDVTKSRQNGAGKVI